MRHRILVAAALGGTLLHGGCLGNGPNPLRTPGDHVAAVADAATEVVVMVPGTALLLLWLMEQELTAPLRSDGGGRGPKRSSPPDGSHPPAEHEPVAFPPAAARPDGVADIDAPGHACG